MLRYKVKNLKTTDVKSILKRKLIYKLLAKLLLYISFITISCYCFLDYSQSDFHTVKYLLLYSSVMTQLSSLAIMYLT